jgi:glucose/arabinose dehydrogenase
MFETSRSARRLIVTAAVIVAAVAATTPPVSASPHVRPETMPPGFTDTLVAALAKPTAIAFTPDGRTLVAQQSGQLRVIDDGTLLTTPAIDLAPVACTDVERGLLGVAVDPNFSANHFIYLDYTHKYRRSCEIQTAKSPHNRVSRFVLKGNHVRMSSETVLVDGMPSPSGAHNAGDVKFGHDGNLYISIGDGDCDYSGESGCGKVNDASRDQFTLIGKVLRITPAGDIPAGNPFQTATDDRCNVTGHTIPGHRCQETYAWGFRNPFRLAFNPNFASTVFRINDTGQLTWEEIDIGLPGADYGWNVREGHCPTGQTTDCGPPPAGMVNPIADYDHSGSCTAITGGAFVPDGAWPAAWDNHYLFADFMCGQIFDLVANGPGVYTITPFAQLVAFGPVDLTFGPDGTGQSLYYTTYADGGQLRVIRSTG